MKNYSLFAILVLLLSCGSDKSVDSRPNNLLSKDSLISVIIDLEVLNVHYENKYKRPALYKRKLDSVIELLLIEKGVTQEQLEKSIDYYSIYPDTIFKIYESTLDSINHMINMHLITDD